MKRDWRGRDILAHAPTLTELPTDLFLAAARWSADSLLLAVPPECRREVDAPRPAQRDGDDVVLAFPEWYPRRPSTRFVPALSVLTARPPGFRFELSARVSGRWTAWVAAASLGGVEFASLPASATALAVEVDEFVAVSPADALRLRARLPHSAAAVLSDARWLVSLSAWDGRTDVSRSGVTAAVRLTVPTRSQMDEEAAVRERICSPTSVAMVLEHHGRSVTTAALAAETFHADLDRYGIWPAAILSAGRHGLAGYVLRFPTWAAAEWCLAAGLPVIASVRYGTGELTGAAVAGTSGHLLVLTGFEGDRVLVNDPAAPSSASVPRRYAIDEFLRAWLGRGGIGYVLFPPPGPPTVRSPVG